MIWRTLLEVLGGLACSGVVGWLIGMVWASTMTALRQADLAFSIFGILVTALALGGGVFSIILAYRMGSGVVAWKLRS